MEEVFFVSFYLLQKDSHANLEGICQICAIFTFENVFFGSSYKLQQDSQAKLRPSVYRFNKKIALGNSSNIYEIVTMQIWLGLKKSFLYSYFSFLMKAKFLLADLYILCPKYSLFICVNYGTW